MRRLAAILGLMPVFVSASAQNMPHIGYVYPAGARQGSIVTLKVGGQFLEGVTNAFVTGGGMEAIVTDFNRPMPQGQFNKIRDRLQELREKRQDTRRRDTTNVWTAADEKELSELRERVLKNPPNRNATVAIADVATFRVTIATNAAPGDREIRLATGNGLSNPMKFCIGTLSEVSAPAARAPNPEEDRLRRLFALPPAEPPSTNIVRVALPAVINGQIMPGQVDRWRFGARRGQQLVIAVSARDLIPYLADAVPGWFQATIALYDSKGKELAYDDDFRFQPDPVLHFEIPRDGDYVLEIKDSIYRGREDFVYRITVGELPFVTSIFPLGGRVGEKTTVELNGCNLAETKLIVEHNSAGVTSLHGNFANVLPFAVDSLPETREREPNNSAREAEKLSLPAIVNGRIGKADDVDVFRINGKAGGEVVAEVMARRLNSPLDSVLSIADATGKQLAANDDCEDKACGLNTHHADSYVRFTLPTDGPYFIRLSDAQRHGGEDYGYRLRVSAPRPDFELRAVPASLTIRPGGTASVRVVALRKDGFTNDISIALRDAPIGFKLSGPRISALTNEVKLTLTAPATRASEPFTIALEGRAKVSGREIVRSAVPAEDMMQAFFYRHFVPAKEFQVAVTSRGLGLRRIGP